MEWTSPMKPTGRPWLGRRGRARLLSGLVLIAIATASPGTAAAGASAPSGYAVTILSSLSRNPNRTADDNAAGVNDWGLIVGDATYPRTWTGGGVSYPPNRTEHATLWRNGRITDLGTLGGPNSSIGFVAGPSDTGLISGNAQTATPDPFNEQWAINLGCAPANAPCDGTRFEIKGFVWEHGAMRALPTLGGNNALGFGVANDLGQLSGVAEDANQDPSCLANSPAGGPQQHLDWEPVVWGPRYGEIHELPLPAGDTVGSASAINDHGQVVGGSGFCGPIAFANSTHALLWQGGSPIELGSFGGAYDNLGTAINNRGQVIGWSDEPGDTATHSFLWQRGIMTDLGTLPNDVNTYAYGINDAGQVVGQSCDQNGNCQAFLWQNGTMTDLNTIAHLTTPGSFDLPQAEGVNAQGEIVGNAIDNKNGNILAFSAVPCDSSPATEETCNEPGSNTTPTAGPRALSPQTVLTPDRGRLPLSSLLGPP